MGRNHFSDNFAATLDRNNSGDGRKSSPAQPCSTSSVRVAASPCMSALGACSLTISESFVGDYFALACLARLIAVLLLKINSVATASTANFRCFKRSPVSALSGSVRVPLAWAWAVRTKRVPPSLMATEKCSSVMKLARVLVQFNVASTDLFAD